MSERRLITSTSVAGKTAKQVYDELQAGIAAFREAAVSTDGGDPIEPDAGTSARYLDMLENARRKGTD